MRLRERLLTFQSREVLLNGMRGEVARLFAAIDIQPMSAYSNKALVDPVLFRMLYGAGLRISEC